MLSAPPGPWFVPEARGASAGPERHKVLRLATVERPIVATGSVGTIHLAAQLIEQWQGRLLKLETSAPDPAILDEDQSGPVAAE